LTNLQDKIKCHMHARHYLHEANTDTLLYKLWQKLRDTPERAANNQYTITPLPNLSIPTHKVHQLATKLHCHAIKSLNKITIHFINNNSVNGGYERGVTGRVAGFRRARHRLDCMADNPSDPH